MDKALKQRLVGASVLIALAVVVLPMLLSGRPDNASQQSQKIELPPRPEELSFETRRFPVSGEQAENRLPQDPAVPSGGPGLSATQREPGQEGGSIRTEDSAAHAKGFGRETPETSLNQAAPVATSPQVPVTGDQAAVDLAAAPPAPGTPITQQGGRYAVQVASLGSTENASRLMTALQEKGFPVLFDTVVSAVGQLNRVRVGPFASESEAAEVSERIDKELAGVNPRVVDLQPDEAGAGTPPSDSLVRWVVQVGSFAEASNVERLVGQLREQGMSAYSETVTTSSSSIFRVRIGPFLEREQATRVKQQLLEKFSIDGVVMSAD